MSAEHRAKISAALKGKPRGPKSPEHRRKLSEANKGKPQGAAQKARAAENLHGWYATPEGQAFRKEHLEKLHVWARSPENIERLKKYNATPEGVERSRAVGRITGLYAVLGEELRERDGDLCQLCLEKIDFSLPIRTPLSRTVDHVIPLKAGGSNETSNLWLAHMVCNQRKGTRWVGRFDGSTDVRS